MRTGIFLQVRLDSQRLPRKALLPLPDGNIVQHAMRALKGIEAEIYAILTDAESRESLGAFAAEEGFELFVGPREDVLKRYCLAAAHFRVDQVIRATGDNPLVSAEMGRAILSLHAREQADLSHFVGLPLGTGVEVVKSGSLMDIEKKAQDPFEREHLTTYFYRNRQGYKVLEKNSPKKFHMPEVKVSVDTPEDYAWVSYIYAHLYRGAPVEIEHLIRWLRRNKSVFRRKKGEGESAPVTGVVKRQWHRAS